MRLAEMTWREVEALDRTRAVPIVPVGAIEAHGPHLPLDADVRIATAMAEAAATLLSAGGRPGLVLPPIAYTTACFAAGFAGTIGVRPEIVTDTLLEIGRSLAAQGFSVLAVANAHLEPAHRKAIRLATLRAPDEGAIPIVFPDVTRRHCAARLTEEFRSGACHAGQYETSILMAATPAIVREDVRRQLEPNPASLVDAIASGVETFEGAGGPDAYFGDPAAATADEGEATIAILGELLADAVRAEIGRDDA